MRPSFVLSTACRAAVLFLTLGNRALAQREPATVPTVLATVLVGGFVAEMGMAPHFVVGREPGGWPTALRPGASWKPVGGVELGPMLVAVFDAPPGRDATADYEAVLTRAGLKLIDLARPDVGFVAEAPARRMYCNDSLSVTTMLKDSVSATRPLAVTVVRGEAARGCQMLAAERRESPLDVPPLRAPTGVAARRRGSSWGGGSLEQNAQLDTTLSVDAILDHYSRQLAAAGWTIGKPLVDAGTGLQRLSVRDRNGTEWQGALLVVTTGQSRQVALQMMKPSSDATMMPY
jgi:hypothetical protein